MGDLAGDRAKQHIYELQRAVAAYGASHPFVIEWEDDADGVWRTYKLGEVKHHPRRNCP